MTELELTRPAPSPVWGWEIPVYLFLGGLAAGLMILGALLRRRVAEPSRVVRAAPLLAALIVSAGMAALFLDLRYKLHVFRFYLAFRPLSPMSWGAWILAGVYPVTLLLGLGALHPEDQARLLAWRPVRALRFEGLLAWGARVGAAHTRRLEQASLALGVGLGLYTGVLLSTLGARAAWGSPMLAPLFLVSGLSAAAALLLLLRITPEEREHLDTWDARAIAAEVVVLALFLIGLLSAGRDGRAAAALLLSGPYAAPSFALVVLAGLAAPLTMHVLHRRRGLPCSALAPALVLAGGLALRWILVLAGQA